MKPEDFENYLGDVKFDDRPDFAHRDRLEQKLLASLAGQPLQQAKYLRIWRLIINNRIVKFAAAAVIMMAIGLFIIKQYSYQKAEIVEVTNVTQSPTDMMSILSLNLAYNRGGLEEVDRQYKKAVNSMGPRPKQITVKELLAELNGI